MDAGDCSLHDLVRYICGAPLLPADVSEVNVNGDWPDGGSVDQLEKMRSKTLTTVWSGSGDLPVLINYLVDCQANPDQLDGSIQTPLQLAAREGHLDVVNALLTKPAFPSNRTSLGRALHASLEMCSTRRIGGGLHCRVKGRPAFEPDHFAVAVALANLPQLDVNTTNQDGDSALMVALRRGPRQAWEVLLDRKDVDIEVQNRSGQTAFHMAAAFNSAEACRRLLAFEKSAQLLARKDRRRRTAEDIAKFHRCQDVIEILQCARQAEQAERDAKGMGGSAGNGKPGGNGPRDRRQNSKGKGSGKKRERKGEWAMEQQWQWPKKGQGKGRGKTQMPRQQQWAQASWTGTNQEMWSWTPIDR